MDLPGVEIKIFSSFPSQEIENPKKISREEEDPDFDPDFSLKIRSKQKKVPVAATTKIPKRKLTPLEKVNKELEETLINAHSISNTRKRKRNDEEDHLESPKRTKISSEETRVPLESDSSMTEPVNTVNEVPKASSSQVSIQISNSFNLRNSSSQLATNVNSTPKDVYALTNKSGEVIDALNLLSHSVKVVPMNTLISSLDMAAKQLQFLTSKIGILKTELVTRITAVSGKPW